MVNINTTSFAQKIQEYLEAPATFNQEAIVDTLNLIDPLSKWKKRKGITFGYNTQLVMQLLARAYVLLTDKIDSHHFSEEVAKAVQDFAQPFPSHDNLCYPHFLFHGLVQPTLDEVVERLNNNARIIHETLRSKDKIMKEHKSQSLDGNLQLSMSNGCTDDYFGIAYLLAKQDIILLSSANGYIAKASFFVDETNKEIYVITLQGRRFGSNDPVRQAHPSGQERRIKSEQEYSKFGNILGMSPRRFILASVMDFGRENRFERIRVIKPQEHPMFIEMHEGFYGNYEPVIKKAGINQENGCYLEARL